MLEPFSDWKKKGRRGGREGSKEGRKSGWAWFSEWCWSSEKSHHGSLSKLVCSPLLRMAPKYSKPAGIEAKFYLIQWDWRGEKSPSNNNVCLHCLHTGWAVPAWAWGCCPFGDHTTGAKDVPVLSHAQKSSVGAAFLPWPGRGWKAFFQPIILIMLKKKLQSNLLLRKRCIGGGSEIIHFEKWLEDSFW